MNSNYFGLTGFAPCLLARNVRLDVCGHGGSEPRFGDLKLEEFGDWDCASSGEKKKGLPIAIGEVTPTEFS